MDVVLIVLRILIKVLAVFWGLVLGWQLVIGLCGLLPLKTKFRQKQGKVQRTHRFAAVICARNEELVIGKLIESLRQQNYPEECLKVFVVADNCTDHTAEAARRAGAEVLCAPIRNAWEKGTRCGMRWTGCMRNIRTGSTRSPCSMRTTLYPRTFSGR